jgi:hypothetical protein
LWYDAFRRLNMQIREWKPVRIDALSHFPSLEDDPPSLKFDSFRYTLEVQDKVFPQETVRLLLLMHPILAVHIGKNHHVIAGSRMFYLASRCLPNEEEITVGVIDNKHTTDQEIQRVRYLDIALSPLIHTLEGSSADYYQLVNIPTYGKDNLNIVKREEFAEVLGVTVSALFGSYKKPRNQDIATPKANPAGVKHAE